MGLAAAMAVTMILAGCASSGGGSSGAYYDPYPYRTGVSYHRRNYYRTELPSRPPPSARPPARPRPR